jgi:hypothetical protein
MKSPSFADDVAFLKNHVEVIVLEGDSGARVAVVPEYQGRVMTSTSGGESGPSFGWLNRAAIASGERQDHINVFGGEDRFWLGPEGGQYAIFFQAGDPFDLEHWQTPEPIDWGPWETIQSDGRSATFTRTMELENYSGAEFHLEAERTVRVVGRDRVGEHLGVGVELGGTALVAFETENAITNVGDAPWQKETGLLSIWILGMFNPSPETTVVLPFRGGEEGELGPVVNDTYFGKVPEDRLVAGDGVLFFRGDGQYRSKIGVSRPRVLPTMGSYDRENRVLTIVQYTLPEDAVDYVNSMWELQDEPYGGDVVNSYNDGPPSPGAAPLGPFYELESSSPAAALVPGDTLTHVHRTIHVSGAEEELDAIAQNVLGVSLETIASAFPTR